MKAMLKTLKNLPLLQHFYQLSPLRLSLLLTLAIALIHFSVQMMPEFGHRLLAAITGLLCICGLLFQHYLKKPWLYLSLSLCLGIFVFKHWQFQDNHIYLWAYWILAITVCAFSQSFDKYLSKNAKLLTGLTMLFAAIQKARAINYISGTFFYFTFLTDRRFAILGRLFQPDFYQALHRNNQLLLQMEESLMPVSLLGGNPELLMLAQVVTWFTLLIEAFAALCFLAPSHWRLASYRHIALILFCAVYFLVPVKGFAAVLILMGLAQLKPQQQGLKIVYTLLLIYIYWFASLVLSLLH